MKRTLSVMLAIFLCVTLVLSGCGGGNKTSGESTDTGTTDTTEPATNETEGEEPAKEEPASDEIIEITYATWGNPEFEDKKIKAFEAAHPNIKVKRDESITWPWNEKLAAAAAAGKMPDVFWVFNVSPGVINGWLEDLTPYLEADPEYSSDLIYGNLTETSNYFGKQYAMPQGLFAHFMVLNLDLFEKENVPVPSPNWTVDEMRDIAIKLTKFNDHQFGLQNPWGLREYLVPAFDPSLGWLTWDGEKYNFDNPAYAETMHFVHGLLFKDKVTPDIYPQEDKDAWYGKDTSPWTLGKIGMMQDATWSLGWYKDNSKFKWDVRPLPGNKGQRLPLVTDYIGMSKTSKHKEAAFELVKWMSYSKEGWLSRIDIENPIGSMPVINDPEVWEKYLNAPHVPEGMKEIVKMIPDGFIDPFKPLPGYTEVQKMVNDKMKDFEQGKAKPEDFAEEFQQKAMQIHEEAWKQIEEATKK